MTAKSNKIDIEPAYISNWAIAIKSADKRTNKEATPIKDMIKRNRERIKLLMIATPIADNIVIEEKSKKARLYIFNSINWTHLFHCF